MLKRMVTLEHAVYGVYWQRFQRQNIWVCCFPDLAMLPVLRRLQALAFVGFCAMKYEEHGINQFNMIKFKDKFCRTVSTFWVALMGTNMGRTFRISGEKVMPQFLINSLQSPPSLKGTGQILCLPIQDRENRAVFPSQVAFIHILFIVMAKSQHLSWQSAVAVQAKCQSMFSAFSKD